MTENLSLRKELCLALGWRLQEGVSVLPLSGEREIRSVFHHADCHDTAGDFYGSCDVGKFTRTDRQCLYEHELPAYESNATLSEELLDKVCREKRWIWCVNIDATGIQYWCQIADFTTAHGVSVLEGAATPSEARAKALLRALRDRSSG